MSTSLKELAYTYIRGRLLEGRISPGTRLSSRALAREIGVSFIPVREAITQLAAEGLVDHEPGIGTFAARVTQDDLRELYELREALEVHAIGLAAEKIGAAGLAEIAKCNDELRAIARARRDGATADESEHVRAWTRADLELHLALLTAAGNSRLVRAVKDLRILTQVFRAQRVLRPAEDLERACAQHDVLLEALRARDAVGARAAMSDHIRFASRNAVESHQTPQATP